MLRGIVHDPTARRMGGVAGHAGLFSTADDLAKFAQDLLSGFNLSQLTVEKMSTPQQPANAPSQRGLGWDIDSPFASNRGELSARRLLRPYRLHRHLAVDRSHHRNLHHPAHQRRASTRRQIRSLAAHASPQRSSVARAHRSEQDKLRLARITGYNESLMASRRMTSRNGEVKTGIDVLEADASPNCTQSNHPSPDRPRHQSDCDRFARAIAPPTFSRTRPAFNSPPSSAPNTASQAPSIPTTSATQRTQQQARRSTASTATRQSAACPRQKHCPASTPSSTTFRTSACTFYTYESTLGYFLEAAAKASKPIVVLDRPNPVTGVFVQGPVADPGRESFVSLLANSRAHGMTIGELAKMFNTERASQCQLTVVPMEGWMRGDWFDSTGLAMDQSIAEHAQPHEATLYPGIGMIEAPTSP
jgi:hypothetical protein